MEAVLGVSMAPTAVRMVLVDGENADGATVDTEKFEVPAVQDPATSSGPNQVISAILGTREGAGESGYRLASIGVTWTDPVEAAALRDLLAGRKVENVMLVSAFLAAAALAQTVGNATGYANTGLLFVEPDTATLAVVDSADGSVVDVHRQPLPEDDADAMAELAAMVSAAESLETRPDGLLVVGSDGVDIAAIKPQLEAATSLALNAPEEPELALARGAALASANAPLFSSSTAAVAYAQDPGTGAVTPSALAGYLNVPADGAAGEEDLAYSAVPDEEAGAATVMAGGANAYTEAAGEEDFRTGAYPDFGAAQSEQQPATKPFLVAMSVLMLFVVGVVALVMALAFDIRPHANQRPTLGANVVAPAKPAPAPAVPVAPAHAPAPVAPAPAVPVAPPAPPPALPPPPIPQLPAPPIPGPRIPGPGIPGPGIPGPGIPGPGIPGPHIPGPGIPHIPIPGIPHL